MSKSISGIKGLLSEGIVGDLSGHDINFDRVFLLLGQVIHLQNLELYFQNRQIQKAKEKEGVIRQAR